MRKNISFLIVGILTTSLCAFPVDIGIKASKNVKQVTKVFKNINKSEGLTEFDSKLYTEQLPMIENAMECNSEEAKQFVIHDLLSDNYDKPSFIGGHKVIKKSKNVTYCSVSYKTGEYLNKANYWIVNENGQVHPCKYKSMPIQCDDIEVLEYFKAIAKARNITIEDLGGFESNGLREDRSECTVAYKTSDMSDLEVLKYELSRDEDFKVVLKTD